MQLELDLNLTRSFNYYGEGRRLELRWDMLNAFNNTHFGAPNNDVTSGQFGQITNLAGDPRVMQFALKLMFYRNVEGNGTQEAQEAQEFAPLVLLVFRSLCQMHIKSYRLLTLLLTSLILGAQTRPRDASHPGSRVLMDAHNCYPYSEWWTDRIDRALSTGTPLAIEQDLIGPRIPAQAAAGRCLRTVNRSPAPNRE